MPEGKPGSKRVTAARRRFRNASDVFSFAVGLVVIVLGALMLADGIVGWLNDTSFLFEGVNRGFEFVVGFMGVVLGASLIPEEKE